MCGIAGIISANTNRINEEVLMHMGDALAHRGPDGAANWIGAKRNAGFAHRRLSIIDLSERASQPMHFGERFTIVYNGDIYNYLELRTELQKKGMILRPRFIFSTYGELLTGYLFMPAKNYSL